MSLDYRRYVNDGAYERIRELCKKRNYKCIGCRYSYRYIVKKDDPLFSNVPCCIFGDMPKDWAE